jgi:hypothetical protein
MAWKEVTAKYSVATVIFGKVVANRTPFSFSDSRMLVNQSQPLVLYLEFETFGEDLDDMRS